MDLSQRELGAAAGCDDQAVPFSLIHEGSQGLESSNSIEPKSEGRCPLFQILIPTYNASRWFEEALSSVTGHPFGEVLVIDDGSEDDEREKTRSICARFPDVRFFAEPHRGIVDTLNFGLSQATAPYVARMDADDISLPGRFDQQMAALESDPNLALIGGQFAVMDECGTLTGKVSNFPLAHDSIVETMLTGRGCIQHPSVMMRRDAVVAVGGYRKITEYAEDYDLFLRLSERYHVANLSDVILRYRTHKKQITQSVKWPQTIASHLALISAKQRRLLQPDPLHLLCEFEISDTASAMSNDECKVLLWMFKLTSRDPHLILSNLQLEQCMSVLKSKLTDIPPKHRARLFAKISTEALRSIRPKLFLNSFFHGVRSRPSSFVKELIH